MGKYIAGTLLMAPLVLIAWLFVDAIFLGGTDACPQNLC